MSAVIDDCVAVDKALTPVFEETEWIPEDITLEVSSPGLYRPLRTKEHFEWVKGQEVQLHLKQKLDFDDLPRSLKGQKKIKVKLVSVDEDFLLVNDGKADREVKLLNIKKANLETAL
jgi:ribosome maturation factor RimP